MNKIGQDCLLGRSAINIELLENNVEYEVRDEGNSQKLVDFVELAN